MYKEMTIGNWNAIKETARNRWTAITDRELHHIDGRYDRLVTVLEIKYGYNRGAAEQEADRFLGRQPR